MSPTEPASACGCTGAWRGLPSAGPAGWVNRGGRGRCEAEACAASDAATKLDGYRCLRGIGTASLWYLDKLAEIERRVWARELAHEITPDFDPAHMERFGSSACRSEIEGVLPEAALEAVPPRMSDLGSLSTARLPASEWLAGEIGHHAGVGGIDTEDDVKRAITVCREVLDPPSTGTSVPWPTVVSKYNQAVLAECLARKADERAPRPKYTTVPYAKAWGKKVTQREIRFTKLTDKGGMQWLFDMLSGTRVSMPEAAPAVIRQPASVQHDPIGPPVISEPSLTPEQRFLAAGNALGAKLKKDNAAGRRVTMTYADFKSAVLRDAGIEGDKLPGDHKSAALRKYFNRL